MLRRFYWRTWAAASLGAGALFGAAAVVACGVDLDVAFVDGGGGGAATDAAEDSRQKVRESSVEVPDVLAITTAPETTFPCDGGLGPDQACDNGAGKGCCLAKGEANCMEQASMNKCEGVFVGCREGTTDTPCCWLDNGKTQLARFVGDCDGGPIACISDGGCPPDLTCTTTTCSGGFEIGQCGDSPPRCP